MSTDATSGILAQAIAAETSTQEPMREVARKTHAGKVLVVCEGAGKRLYLCRERKVKDEIKVKRTADLADFAHALAAGLI